jgi:hypothetical protein
MVPIPRKSYGKDNESICRFHAHPVHQNSVDIFGLSYVGDDFFRVETSLIQSNSRSLRDLVVLESSCTEKDYFCCEEMR